MDILINVIKYCLDDNSDEDQQSKYEIKDFALFILEEINNFAKKKRKKI